MSPRSRRWVTGLVVVAAALQWGTLQLQAGAGEGTGESKNKGAVAGDGAALSGAQALPTLPVVVLASSGPAAIDAGRLAQLRLAARLPVWADLSAKADARFHESWELDRPPEFRFALDGLDELPQRLSRGGTAQVVLRVDAAGGLAAVDVDRQRGFDANDVQQLRALFADASFLPARRGVTAVAAILRFDFEFDPLAPIALGFGSLAR